MTVSLYQFQAYNFSTFVPLPGASVSIYVGSTTNFAVIYDVNGNVTNNPMMANSTGFVEFQADDSGQLVVSAGSYVSPRLLLTTLGSTSASIASALAVIETDIDGIDSTIAAMQAAANSLQASINQAQANITAAQSEINDAFSQLNSIATTLTSIQSQVSNNAAEITIVAGALASDTDALSGEITTLAATVNTNAATAAAAVTGESIARVNTVSATAGAIYALSASYAISNFIRYSQDFTQTSVWGYQFITVTPGQADPIGGTNGTLVAETTDNNFHGFFQSLPSYQVGQFVTGSIYAKDGGRHRCQLSMGDGTVYRTANFDLSAGTANSVDAYSCSVSAVGGGWFRISITVQMAASTTTAFVFHLTQNGVYAGNGSGMYVYGAQATPTLSPVPYIKTDASPLGPGGLAATNAALTVESATRAAVDESLASQVTSLSGTVGSNYASLSGTLTTQANQISALSASVTTFKTNVDGNIATITDQVGTLSNKYGSLAGEIETISATSGTRRVWNQSAAPGVDDMFPPGSNRFVNADFAAGAAGFAAAATSGISGGASAAAIDFATAWTLAGGHTAYSEIGNVTTAGQYFEIDGFVGYSLVTPGKAYEFSAYLGAHRCDVYVYLVFVDSTGNFVGAAASNVNGQGAEWNQNGGYVPANSSLGGQALSGYQRLWVYGTAPSNAARVMVIVRGFPTLNSGSSFAFVTRPFFSVLNTATPTAPSPYSPPNANQVWINTADNNSTYVWTGIGDVGWTKTADLRIDQNTAAISEEKIVRASAVDAIAGNLNTVTTTVDGHTSSISTLTASVNGLATQWALEATINGTTGHLEWTGVAKAGGGALFTLDILSNVNIHGSVTIDGTVAGYSKLMANSVTNVGYAQGNGQATAYVPLRAGDTVLINWYYAGGDSGNFGTFQGFVNGNTIMSLAAVPSSLGSSYHLSPQSFPTLYTAPSAGTYSFTAQIYITGVGAAKVGVIVLGRSV